MTSDEKALIALLVAAFILKKSDTKALATLILAGRIAAMKAAYNQASSVIGASTDWAPDAELTKMAEKASEKDAESITVTYGSDLESVATGFVESWMIDHETLDGCEAAAKAELASWATTRAEWKSEQITGYTCGSGANDGVDLWIGDVVDGDFDIPDDISLDDIQVEIQPSESSKDECEDYAGNRYDFDEDLPDFPMHENCPHRKVIVYKEQ